MKVNSLRRHVNGSGTIRARKMTISVTRSRKTCRKSKSKHVCGIMGEMNIAIEPDERVVWKVDWKPA
jgi:hypothetical protein